MIQQNLNCVHVNFLEFVYLFPAEKTFIVLWIRLRIFLSIASVYRRFEVRLPNRWKIVLDIGVPQWWGVVYAFREGGNFYGRCSMVIENFCNSN